LRTTMTNAFQQPVASPSSSTSGSRWGRSFVLDARPPRWIFLRFVLLLTSSSLFHKPTTTTFTSAFVVLSRQSSNLSLDAIRDARSSKVITIGVLFRDEHAEITAAGQADTQCITSIGDIRGFDRNVHESPQYCVHVANYPATSDFDYAIVAGVAGRQAALYVMNFLGEYDEAPLVDPFLLPVGTFPVAMVTDPKDGGVYVGLHDTGGTLVREWNKPLEDVLTYINSVTQPEDAWVISPVAMKVDMTQVVWQTEFTTTAGQSLIGGMAHIPSENVLVVAGSTDGLGPSVGATAHSDDWDGGDWDGYVTILNGETGSVERSVRIQSQSNQDDFIHGICALDDEIFIVGSTTGSLEPEQGGVARGGGGAFVMKLDVSTLEILWTRQFRGAGVDDSPPVAMECEVKAGSLFVGGQVPAGVLMEQDDSRTNASDNQDLLVMTMDPSSSEVYWVRQIDSRRDDRLSNIMIAANGDLFIMANAMDFENESNDSYLMTVTRQDGIHDWLGLPEDADPIDGVQAGVIDGDGEGVGDSMLADESDNEGNLALILIAALVPVGLLLLVAICSVATAGRSKLPVMEDEAPNHKDTTVTVEPSTVEGKMT